MIRVARALMKDLCQFGKDIHKVVMCSLITNSKKFLMCLLVRMLAINGLLIVIILTEGIRVFNVERELPKISMPESYLLSWIIMMEHHKKRRKDESKDEVFWKI